MDDKKIKRLTKEAIILLKKLIATSSFSSEEDNTAMLIEDWFIKNSIRFERDNNNVWAYNLHFDNKKPTLLLNSHHDTVKPNSGYSINPFDPVERDGKLFGLGSNDAGGCLVSLMATFTYFYKDVNLPYNLVIAASAEEESNGPKGLRSIIKKLPEINCAIVGEPTEMQLAIAEKGLLVLDVLVNGTPSHAAHKNDDNAIYNAVSIIQWFKEYEFAKVSELLGPIKMTVTGITAGKQHNVVPDECHLVVDVRVNDCYSNFEVLSSIQNHLTDTARVIHRSTDLNSSSIDKSHPLVLAGIALGRETYGSPTLSDQSVLQCQSLKLGPGNSLRSHTADEFIYIAEIEEGIMLYINLLSFFFHQPHRYKRII